MWEDRGPDFNRQFSRYVWTPPRWFQIAIAIVVVGSIFVLPYL